MGMLPRITVVTPSYNQGRYLEETIESVLTQGYPRLEYMVIDGGSTDESVAIIQKHAPHINYWVSERDDGQSAAINKGFQRASGDVLCWLNSDDVFLPGALLCVGEAFERNPGADVIMGYTLLVDAEKRIQKCVYNLIGCTVLAKHGVIPFSQQSMFWRTELMNRVGHLDESLQTSMDTDLWIRFLKSGAKVRCINRYCAAWRLHDACKSVAFDGFSENRLPAMRSGVLNTLDKDRLLLRERHKDYRYRNTARWARALYVGGKLCHGEYLRELLFRARWRGRPLSELCAWLAGR